MKTTAAGETCLLLAALVARPLDDGIPPGRGPAPARRVAQVLLIVARGGALERLRARARRAGGVREGLGSGAVSWSLGRHGEHCCYCFSPDIAAGGQMRKAERILEGGAAPAGPG